MKLKTRIVAVLLAAILIIPMAALVSCSTGEKPPEKGGASYVAIDINPSVELVLDGDGKVVSVYAENEDAEVLLYQSEGIVGEKISVAAENLAKLAEKYGYISEDNKNISVTVSGDGEKTEEELFESIKSSFAKGCGTVAASIESGANILLEKRLEDLKADYPDNADIQALDTAKYRLLRSAMAADRKLTVADGAKMSSEELTAIVSEKHEAAKDIFSRAMEMAVENAEIVYGQTKANLENAVYIKYGGLAALKYMALDNAYFAVALMNKVKGDLAEFGITEAEVRAVAEKIGVPTEKIDQFIEDCKDSNGYVTDETLEYAVNKHYRSLSADARESMEAKLTGLTDEIDAFAQRVNSVSAEVIEAVNSALSSLSLVADFDVDFEIKTYDDIALLADDLRVAADESYASMIAGISEENKAKIEEEILQLDSKLEQAETVMKNAIDRVKLEAEEFLKAAQNARLEAKS
ncbi:MAG: hypothetical protein IKB34_01490 [Clostridia bacterium]|nr:hypothetical protein [Clostridia bacterium]